MLRRAILAVLAIIFTVAFEPRCLAATEAPPRPNLIFVMADDLGYGDLGSYGQQRIRTPRLDQMAAEGIRFTEVYTGSPICAPTRSVLMTGQHTGNTRVRGNFGNPAHGGVPCSGGANGSRVPLLAEDTTVAEILKAAGYVTGMTGKWGLGEPDSTGVPNAKGFDEFFGFLNQRRAHSYYPEYLWRDREKVHLEGNTGTTRDFATQRHYVHDLFTDFALDFVRRHAGGDAPFFLYLPYTVPHDRWQIPELEPYAEESDWSKEQKVYASMVTRLDRDMGRLLDLLRETGIDETTLVFFCSDNGAQNRYDGVFDSSGPLRGMKRSLYDGGLRTPMIARWPGTIEAGAVSSDIWYFPDVLPTLAELAGAEAPDGIDGLSVVPSLLSRPMPELRERALYWEDHERGFRQAARRGDWKAVRNGHDASVELYDLSDDVGEENDLSSEHPETVARFERLFREARTPSPNWPSPLDDSPGQ